ncbi:MAG TPA: hypothetical protein VFX30_10655 [bacterium]|nr:hypothetical protein [bacterium]
MPRLRIAAFAALALLSMPSLVSAQRVERQNTIYFSNIAPGELENEVLKTFPVKIMMQSESGKMYAGAYVRVFNASGIAVFKKMCEKPWLFLKLPEGDYNVVAVDRNKITRLKAFAVSKQPEEGVKRTVVKLSWPKKVVGY